METRKLLMGHSAESGDVSKVFQYPLRCFLMRNIQKENPQMVNLIVYISDKVHDPAIKFQTTPQNLTIDTFTCPPTPFQSDTTGDGMWRLL